MNLLMIAAIVGFYGLIFGVTLIAPLLVGVFYGEPALHYFGPTMVGSLLIGLTLWRLGRSHVERLSVRDGYLVVSLFWLLLGLLGALPLMDGFKLSLTDALFESVSGLTTTGATVLDGLDLMPRSLLFYRQQLQWFGGMGLIVLGVAVMPMLGIGGMQLYRAEAPGPLKEEKLTPRLARTARALWLIYLMLTLICAFAYWLAGMTPFDAICHALSTLSTGGFSTHDASMAFFDSLMIELIAVVFMILASINFGLHFMVFSGRDPMRYLRDIEARSFLIIVSAAALLIAFILWFESDRAGGGAAFAYDLRLALFEVVAVITSTGFGTVDFSRWPDFLPVLLMCIGFIGGCGGSTAGGIKVLRIVLMAKQGMHQVLHAIHPRAVFPMRLGKRVVDAELAQSVWGFFALYVVTFVILALLMIHAGLTPLDAFSAVATTINNIGPGLGEVASSFQSVSDSAKWTAVVAMLLGRLEILTLLIILSPVFWRR